MRVLVAAYTVLAVAAGARAGVQLATRAGEAPVPYALSAVAAVVYLVLAVSLRRRGRWLDLAAVAAAAELAGVLWVGTAERLGAVAWPDQTVWSGYGAGYGFAPLVLPVAALVVLAARHPGMELRPSPARYAPGNQPRGAAMSAFTPSEIDYLNSQGLARLATVGPDGQPHVVPVTFTFNAGEDAIDVGGVDFGATKKWRDARRNPRVTFLLDDVLRNPRRARAIEVRGRAEALTSGGSAINPRFHNFAEEFLRIRPTRIVSWGLEEARDGTTPADFRVSSRPVG